MHHHVLARSGSHLFPGILLGVAAVCGPWVLRASGEEPPPLTERQKTVHVLNRLGFGPRPGDVERVEKMGLQVYIQQQLHPESVDDAAAEKAVASLDTLQMGSDRLMKEYYGDIRRFIQMQKTPGNMEEMKLRYGVDASKYKSSPAMQEPPEDAGKSPLEQFASRDALRCVGELQEAKLMRAVLSERQLDEVLVDFWSNHFNIDVKKNDCRVLKPADDRDAIRPHVLGKFRDLLGASAKSPAMLHYLDNQENSVAREHSDLEKLMISNYVKNNLGMDAKGMVSDKEGPNENYGREIMELHTLGVDAGYTQQDVQEVARCFSGWSSSPFTGKFEFNAHRHDNGEKTVLGHVIPARGGIKDGEMVLDILCSNPATAHHIALQMCQRFVSDDPSPDLVNRIAGVFTQTNGDLRKVTEAILTSPEFLSPANYNNKIKSPLEFAVSAVRASQSSIIPQQPAPYDKLVAANEGGAILGRGAAADRISKRPRQSLNWHIYELGEPLFACTPPTGYKEVSKFWVSPGALIERLNFALALTQQQVSDIHFSPQTILAGIDLDKPEAVLNQSVAVLLQDNITPSTRKVLEQTALPAPGESKTVNPSKLIALIIGSPEFQRK